MRKSTKLLLALALLVGGPFYWLLIDNHHGQAPDYRLDIAALRAEANRIPGAKPRSIDYEIVAMKRYPGAYMVAGTGIKRRLLGIMSFRINASGGAIVIGSGVTPAQCRQLGCESYFPRSQQLVERAMRDARAILFSSEDLDDMGGFVASRAWPVLADKAMLTAEQGPGSPVAGALPWPADRSALRPPLPSAPIQAIAPGVVVIRTPGHSPGSQMVFVQLADGKEFLFAGDVAPFARNIIFVRTGSRLLTDWIRPEDRAQQYAWLKAIRGLIAQAPTLAVIPGHDPDFLFSVRNGRPLKLHFDNASSVPAGLEVSDDDDDS